MVNDRMLEVMNSPVATIAFQLTIIVLLVILARYALRLAARQVEKQLKATAADPEQFDRLHTLTQVARAVAWSLILALAGLMALHVLGINIAPLLAGAGAAGLALSLGSQTLIKDYIGGVLILVENQFTIGDVIKLNNVSGSVERITLRATYVRDIEGLLHIVPNGEIRTVSNLTAEWARAVVDLNVDYTADMSTVMRALEAASASAQKDEAISADLLEPPQALGWIGSSDWAVQVRLMVKTLPGKQWEVMMALRKHALEALQAEGVRVAIPSQEIRLAKGELSRQHP